MQRWIRALAVVLVATSGLASASTTRNPEARPQLAAARTAPAAEAGADRLMRLQPMAATSPGETHAFLAVSSNSFGAGGTPYTFSGKMRTVQQLRTPAPNAWEVAWIVWNYVDNDHLYYFVLKPNGWEIGKRDPRYRVPGVNDGQKIIATGEGMKLALGRWYRFDVKVTGARAEIAIDGVPLVKFHDTDTSPLLAGRVGLYGEDAVCEWNDITAPFADSFETEPLQAFADGSRLSHWEVPFLGYGAGGIVARPRLVAGLGVDD